MHVVSRHQMHKNKKALLRGLFLLLQYSNKILQDPFKDHILRSKILHCFLSFWSQITNLFKNKYLKKLCMFYFVFLHAELIKIKFKQRHRPLFPVWCALSSQIVKLHDSLKDNQLNIHQVWHLNINSYHCGLTLFPIKS